MPEQLTRSMELPSIEFGKAAGKTGLVGKIRSLNLDTLNLKHLLDVQVEMLDYRCLGCRGDIRLE